MSRATEIQQLYIGLLGRAADPVGLDYWTNNGLTIDEIAANIVNEQDEFSFNEEQRQAAVEALYLNLFGRPGTAEDVNYWTNESLTPIDQLLFTMIEGAGATDAAALTNRTYVADAYTQFADFDKAAAAAVIAGVDHTPKSVADALATIEGAAGDPTEALEAYIAAQEAVAAAVEAAGVANETALETALEGAVATAATAVVTQAGNAGVTIDLAADSEGVVAAKIADAQTALATNITTAQTTLATATTALNQFSGLKSLADGSMAAAAAAAQASQAQLDAADARDEQLDIVAAYVALQSGVLADYIDEETLTRPNGDTYDRISVDTTAAELEAAGYTAEQATEFLAALNKYASLFNAEQVALENSDIADETAAEAAGDLAEAIAQSTDSTAAGAAVTAYQNAVGALNDAREAQADFAEALANLGEAQADLAGFEALVEARDEALEALGETGFAVEDLVALPVHSTFGTDEADLYVFGGYDGGESVSISGFGAVDQDMIFFGEGFTLFELAADTNIQTTRVGDAGALEIFWQQQGANTVLYVELEAEAGRDVGAGAFENLVTITLTGVTGAELTGLQDGYFVA